MYVQSWLDIAYKIRIDITYSVRFSNINFPMMELLNGYIHLEYDWLSVGWAEHR